MSVDSSMWLGDRMAMAPCVLNEPSVHPLASNTVVAPIKATLCMICMTETDAFVFAVDIRLDAMHCVLSKIVLASTVFQRLSPTSRVSRATQVPKKFNSGFNDHSRTQDPLLKQNADEFYTSHATIVFLWPCGLRCSIFREGGRLLPPPWGGTA